MENDFEYFSRRLRETEDRLATAQTKAQREILTEFAELYRGVVEQMQREGVYALPSTRPVGRL